jgi:hypothetical protein
MKLNLLLKKLAMLVLLAVMVMASGTASAGGFVPYNSKGVAGLIDFPDLLPIVCDRSAVEDALNGKTFDALDGGTATHLGKYASTMELSATPIFVEIFPGFECLVALHFQGLTNIEAANGDIVESLLVVTLNLLNNDIDGTYTVLGGTGRWDGATGEGLVAGNLNEDGTFSYKTNGNISRPSSRK